MWFLFLLLQDAHSGRPRCLKALPVCRFFNAGMRRRSELWLLQLTAKTEHQQTPTATKLQDFFCLQRIALALHHGTIECPPLSRATSSTVIHMYQTQAAAEHPFISPAQRFCLKRTRISNTLHPPSESGFPRLQVSFLEGYCIKINSFPRVPVSSPESGISGPLMIYSGCVGHGHPGERGVYISHTAMWSTEVMV